MKTKRKSFYFIAIIIFCIIYILFAIKPIETEHQFKSGWKIDVTNPTIVQRDENEEFLHFKLGKTMGYFTESGKVINFISFPYKATISEEYYTFYDKNNNLSKIYNYAGDLVTTIKQSGFPLIHENRIFIFGPGGASFSYFSESGEKKFEYEGTTPITAFASSKNACVAGFANGSICEFDLQGKLLQQFSPGGSDYPIILGLAISNDASMIACISGHNKQRFVLAKNENVNAKIIFHEFLNSSSPYQMLVKFYDQDNFVVYNSNDALGFVDIKNGKSTHIKTNGQAINIQESKRCLFILTKSKDLYMVYVIEKNTTKLGEFSFKANVAFIAVENENLYIGKDATISKIMLEKN